MHVEPAVIVAVVTAVTGAIGWIARAGFKGDWVFGREYRSMRDDRDFWRREAWANRRVASTAVSTGEELSDAHGP